MKVKTKRNIFIILAAVWILFIFWNSWQPAATSSQMSGGIVARLVGLLTKIGVSSDEEMLTFIVRKTAHFTEYAVLGVLSSMIFVSQRINTFQSKINVLFIGVMSAICDEAIQLMSDGRSGEIRDVFIDFFGVLTGVLIVYIVTTFTVKRKKKRG